MLKVKLGVTEAETPTASIVPTLPVVVSITLLLPSFWSTVKEKVSAVPLEALFVGFSNLPVLPMVMVIAVLEAIEEEKGKVKIKLPPEVLVAVVAAVLVKPETERSVLVEMLLNTK